jgi:flagellar biosynthesis protein
MNKPRHNVTGLQNAVALAYQTGDAAPKIVAKGKGLVAEQIIAKAKEHGVYVHQSKELVSLLMQVDLDQDIPPALYRVVAELLAWLYHMENTKLTTFLDASTDQNNNADATVTNAAHNGTETGIETPVENYHKANNE